MKKTAISLVIITATLLLSACGPHHSHVVVKPKPVIHTAHVHHVVVVKPVKHVHKHKWHH